MAKADIKPAFRFLPVSHSSYSFLGFFFDSFFFYDMTQWVVLFLFWDIFQIFTLGFESGFDNIIHYLDDFLFVGQEDF